VIGGVGFWGFILGHGITSVFSCYGMKAPASPFGEGDGLGRQDRIIEKYPPISARTVVNA